MQRHFSAGSGAYYSDAIFFLSVAMHHIMPQGENVTNRCLRCFQTGQVLGSMTTATVAHTQLCRSMYATYNIYNTGVGLSTRAHSFMEYSSFDACEDLSSSGDPFFTQTPTSPLWHCWCTAGSGSTGRYLRGTWPAAERLGSVCGGGCRCRCCPRRCPLMAAISAFLHCCHSRQWVSSVGLHKGHPASPASLFGNDE